MTAPKVDLVKRAVTLWKERQALKDKLKKIEAHLDEIEPKALDWMLSNTIPSMKQNGVTAYIRREVWASLAEGATTDFLRDALAAAGFEPGDVIRERANTQTLSAIVREYDGRNEPLPNSLASAVKVSEVFKLGFRQSA
jgi:hypothetical protein